jgi:hypothetical protein
MHGIWRSSAGEAHLEALCGNDYQIITVRRRLF